MHNGRQNCITPVDESPGGMDEDHLIATAIRLCAASGVIAQGVPVTPASSAALVTMTGCVTRDDAGGRKGTGGRAVASGGDSDKFLLIDARMTETQVRSTGTSGLSTITTNPANTVVLSGARYLLAAKSADVRPHVGHQVEVTGRVTGAAPKNGPPQFEAASVKMISATCVPAK